MNHKIVVIFSLFVLVPALLVSSTVIPANAMKVAIENINNRVMVERGRDYEVWKIDNKEMQLVSGADSWVFDSQLGKFVPHILNVINKRNVEVQSGLVGLRIGPYSAEILTSDMKDLRALETWSVINKGQEIKATFLKQSVRENDNGVLVINAYELDTPRSPLSFTAPVMEIEYIVNDGELARKIITIKGVDVDGLILERKLQDVFGDRIYLNGRSGYLAEAGSFKIEEIDSRMVVMQDDKITLFENLVESHPFIQKIAYAQNDIAFEYSGWKGTSLRLVDPTFSSNAPTEDDSILTNSATGAACPNSSYSKNNATTTINMDVLNPTSNPCRRLYIEWNISSLLTGSTVSQVQFQFEVASVTNPVNCDIVPITTNRPSTSAASAIWNEIGSNMPYVSNDSTCTTTGSGKSITLGSTANTDLQNKISGGWYAIGGKLNNETRVTGINKLVRLMDQSNGAAVTKPTLVVTYTPPSVTIPVTINFRTGSDSLSTAGVNATISGNGCTGDLNHGGGSKSFSCWAASTITLTLPTDQTNSRFRFSTGSTGAQWTSCNSGTCSTQTFNDVTRQFRVGLTLSGLDTVQTIDVTRTILGTAATQSVSGATATNIWPDQASTFTIPSSKTITSSQERFQSYNSSSVLSFSVTSANSGARTILYQHEFSTQFRIDEVHAGVIFAPMPDAVFTATVTTANGTAIAATTFTSDDSQDDKSVLTSRYWVKNGTQTFGAVTWRGLTVLPTGATCSVTSYGNCDVTVYSKHVGYGPPYHHFRIGTDGLTTDVDNVSFDQNAATLTFRSTASGTKDTIVEFLGTDYGAVNRVTIDGTDYSSGNWAVSEVGSGTSILTISDVSMSTHTFVVYFAAASSGGWVVFGGSGGGGGGGGVGGGGGIVLPTPSGTTTGEAFHLKVTVPVYTVPPGGAVTQTIKIEWEGATKFVVSNIQFAENGEWFSFGKSLPYAVTLEGGKTTLQSELPMRVTVPSDAEGVERTIPMRLTAIAGSGTETVEVPVRIIFVSENTLPVYVGIGMVAIVGGAVALRARRK